MFLLVEVRNLFNQKKEEEMRMIYLKYRIWLLRKLDWLTRPNPGFASSPRRWKIEIALYNSAYELISLRKRKQAKRRSE